MNTIRFLRTQYRLSLIAGFSPSKARWRAFVSYIKGY
jgi:hypothetical protein